MTRKHFEKVAAILAREYQMAGDEVARQVVVENITAHLADAFMVENPRFNREKFLTAALGAS